MTPESRPNEPNYTVPVIILSLLIVLSAGYFGKFWYDTLIAKPKQQETAEVKSSTQAKTPETASTVEKSEKPKVDLFVMSFCPYGNLAENTISPVVDLLGDKVDWNLRYVVSVNGNTVSSLHGQPEVDQNVRELCVGNLYDTEKMWEFILYVNDNCGTDGACWKTGATSLGISTADVETCLTTKTKDLMAIESAESQKFGAQASPTMFINGTKDTSVYKYGEANVYKDAICAAFIEAPAECSTELESVSTGVSGSCN